MENGPEHSNVGGNIEGAVEAVRQQAESTGGELESNVEQCVHFTGGSEFDQPLRLRSTKRRSPERYKKLESELQSLAGDILATIPQGKFSPKKKYISQVLSFRNSGHRKEVLRRLVERLPGYPGDLFIWTDEGDHIHFVHDCPYSNGSCRCGIFKDELFRGTFRTNLRGARYINELDTVDWYNVFLYFVYSKWPCTSQIWTRGRLRRSPIASEIIRWKEVLRTTGKAVLAGQDQGVRHYNTEEESDSEYSGQVVRESASDTAEEARQGARRQTRKRRSLESIPKQSKFQRILQKVESLLDNACVIPPTHVKEIFAGPEAIELHDPSKLKYYESSCNIWGMKFNRWTFGELAEFYKDKKPIFYANDINPFVYYHDMETSVYYVDALLKHQFGDDEDLITEFLINIQDWINKYGWEKNPKCNALAIIGPPNSGKNYFFDMLAALCCNVGHIGRVNNKTNQFALQDCVNRRLVVGNEISMEDGAREDFKKLCEGTAFNIRVKFQGDKIFTKAPVLLISNFQLDICTDPHFNNIRLKTLQWSRADLLKTSTLKPYPLCLFELYKMYNIFLQ